MATGTGAVVLLKDRNIQVGFAVVVILVVIAVTASGKARDIAQSGAFSLLLAMLLTAFTRIPFWPIAAGAFLLTDSGRGLIKDAIGFGGDTERGGLVGQEGHADTHAAQQLNDEAEQACEQHGGVVNVMMQPCCWATCADGTIHRLR